MKPINNWKDIEAANDSVRLAPGGYVVKMTSVKNVPDKEYLEIIYDIAEGPEKGRYGDEWGREHPFAHRFIRSYKEKALGMFKGFVKAVDTSNGTRFSEQAETGINEQELVGKLVGVVIGEEEYQNDYGDIKTRLAVRSVKSAQDIRDGKYTVPDVKKLKEDLAQPITPEVPTGFENDPDIPFF